MWRRIAVGVLLLGTTSAQTQQDWTHFVRIGGHSLRSGNAGEIVRSAGETFVFGIEVDNDITGRYESWLDPKAKLADIREAARQAHAAGNHAFVYIAGTECITADAARRPHSMAKDHPDWLQRNLKGEPAVFGGGSAFWIRTGDEDVWITPFAPEWRKVYMERVRQIAATGIDGIYVDIPYWMTHFEGWEDTWASFDDYTVAAFKAKTGLNARADLKLGDFRDANFRRWVDFRIEALTAFMAEIAANAKAVNPKCKTIAEIYPGIEEPAVVVGSDVYDMYPVVDAIAHEYDEGGRAAVREPLHWFDNLVGMYSFRAFAEGKPSWMLTYSWDNDEGVKPADAMKHLAMAQLMAGANTWDARGHVMSGSNDFAARAEIFRWIKEHEKVFFQPRRPIRPIGVYFSDKTRNYFANSFIESYRGAMMLLMQSHLEFQVVTPRTLRAFAGEALVLPDARCLGDGEVDSLRALAASGKTLVVTGETGRYDETGAERSRNPVHALLGIANPGEKTSNRGPRKSLYHPQCPGRDYYRQLQKEFNGKAAGGLQADAGFEAMRAAFIRELAQASDVKPSVEVSASPFVSAQIAAVDGKPHVFLANFKGLRGKKVVVPIPERDVKISFESGRKGVVRMLPFLGSVTDIRAEWAEDRLACVIPEIGRGAVVWVE
ncbi:MAG: hypothetical protein KIT09_18460 [Bryobacteraceae bacterium]|nr:hypothetical protein [Bryobacteraceae bacterium]